jgi:hypothetical protein
MAGLWFFSKLLMPRIGSRGVLAAGFLVFSVVAFGFVYCLTPTTPAWVFASLLIPNGLALGWLIAGLTNLAMTGVQPAYVGETDAAFRLVRQIGANFGVTATAVLLDWRMTLHSSRLLDIANRLDPKTHASISGYAGIVARRAGPAIPSAPGSLQLFQERHPASTAT